MNLARLSAVIAFGALAACGRAPDEALVASYGDGVLPPVSQPAPSTDEPAQESASAAIAEARAAAASAVTDKEKPAPGALAFSPAQDGGEAAATDVADPKDQNSQVAALPKQAEPDSKDIAALPKQDAEPATEDVAALPEQDAEPAPMEPASEDVAARTPEQPVAPPAAQTPGQSYGVQLAAYRQASGAETVWNGLLRAHPDLLAELSKTIRRADLGATRGVVHQLRVGPFADEAAARTLCETLKKRGTDCFVVAPRNRP
ncbi:MAG: SPOR domain-containing protein [Proteobacteria bacterium]|nr:SPOR domain-containing protein [Pseudomonadota bacterium]